MRIAILLSFRAFDNLAFHLHTEFFRSQNIKFLNWVKIQGSRMNGGGVCVTGYEEACNLIAVKQATEPHII